MPVTYLAVTRLTKKAHSVERTVTEGRWILKEGSSFRVKGGGGPFLG
jgi:hypothetical protein